MPIRGLEFHKVSTNEWVSAEFRDPADEDGIRLLGVGDTGIGTMMYGDIPGGSWNQARLNKARDYVQETLIDVRIPLTDPSLVDDPAGPNGVDPARPDFFWDSGDLVARSVIISDVAWSDPATGGSGLTFTLTRARV
jgi:hypothetical protein